MPSANVELVRTVYELLDQRRFDAALHRYADPEIEVEYHGVRLDARATYRGHAGVLEVMAEFEEIFPGYRIEVDELIEAGEDVVAAVRYRGRGLGSGIEIDQPGAHVHTVRDGNVVRWRIYANKAEALAAVGRAT